MKKLRILLFASLMTCLFFIGEQVFADELQPSITYHNIRLDKTTSESDLNYLVNNKKQKDIDFYLQKQDNESAYFQFDYARSVDMVGVKLTGWWPNQQGISEYKIQYLAGEEWKDAEHSYQVDWLEQHKGPETLNLGISEPIQAKSFRLVIVKANHAWSDKICMHEFSPTILQKNNDPIPSSIDLTNLNLMNGKLNYLVENPNSADIDFMPKKNYDEADTFIQYNYDGLVYLNKIRLIGWFPKNQAIKNLSVEYYENGKWKSALPATELPWETQSGLQKEEELFVQLKQAVITKKFRIKINSAYKTWSNKLNMRLVCPMGKVINSQAELLKRVKNIETIKNYGLIGNNYGEFQQADVDQLAALGEKLKGKLDENLTANELDVLVKSTDEQLLAFYQKRNPLNPETTPQVSLQNLSTTFGQKENLIDHQLATTSEFTKVNDNSNGMIEFDFKNKQIDLQGILLNCDANYQPMKEIEFQAYQNGQWQTIYQGKGTWRDTEDVFAGMNLPIDKIETSKIRMIVKQKSVAINEVSFIGKIK
ncbi:discoidin domain-containing protein [Melissococcus plutonius]|uniref:discoidin domain-containing protein n=1 Tax=Melissococcus plutonius TaxID=33970 RepID=UPI0021E5B1FC|nr:discoidin domain-containing protein [Melissococcus plutonius]MCV2498774.1 discoidin domain-containing protein [Melissococcus plutonius]MCV2501349.1 discoidin domain-containing protein [Melissococcus plutonius]MCV2507390.1 discoidin domain-containing protein [Melissococcus plutonius]MCV2526877.1 discoidin domain-containing protein [Melissococcus plutonius]